MTQQNKELYADCPYLHYDPRHGRSSFEALRNGGGARVLARLTSITGPAEGEEGRWPQKDAVKRISATFEVVSADWAMGWLKLTDQDWIKDVMGLPVESPFSLGNAQLGRFTFEPSATPWHMELLNASLGGGLATPDDALRRWKEGITPVWFQARITIGINAIPFFSRVTYFASIFDTGLPAAIDAVSALDEKDLDKSGERFRMPSILEQSAEDYGIQISLKKLRAEHLVVYDVGQGSAQALVRLDHSHITPELYVDMGCGRNHNVDVGLQALRFCTSASPPVILSHADEDHWCGAITKAMASAGFPAHQLAWTAPATVGSAAFIAFARSVWSQGGSVRTLNLNRVTPNTITAKTTTGSLLIAQGTSKQFNHSGLVVAMVREDNKHYWLLPGDCDYHFFPTTLKSMAVTSNCVALTAFHHGAKPMAKTAAPLAVSAGYRRLVYSFGCRNGHGHPTSSAVNLHESAGWTHDAAWINAPGLALPCTSSFARATAWTPSAVSPPSAAPPAYWHAGGVLIGWSTAPLISPKAVCCASGCAAAIPVQT